MSREEKTALNPRVVAWISQKVQPETGAGAEPVDERDRELLALLDAAAQGFRQEMSAEDAVSVLHRVRAEIHEERGRALGRRGVWLSLAAALFGVALGVAALSRFRSTTAPPGEVATESRTIKRVSFESTHEGKVVRFQLELTRVR